MHPKLNLLVCLNCYVLHLSWSSDLDMIENSQLKLSVGVRLVDVLFSSQCKSSACLIKLRLLLCRWIRHHYCAMIMALISLTWDIERGPDCAQKQVIYALSHSFPHVNRNIQQPANWRNNFMGIYLVLSSAPSVYCLIKSELVIAERCWAVSAMGYYARICNDSSE